MSFHINVGYKSHKLEATLQKNLYSVDRDVRPPIKQAKVHAHEPYLGFIGRQGLR